MIPKDQKIQKTVDAFTLAMTISALPYSLGCTPTSQEGSPTMMMKAFPPDSGLCSNSSSKFKFRLKVLPTICVGVLSHTLHREIYSYECLKEFCKTFLGHKRDLFCFFSYHVSAPKSNPSCSTIQVFQVLMMLRVAKALLRHPVFSVLLLAVGLMMSPVGVHDSKRPKNTENSRRLHSCDDNKCTSI